MACLTLDAVNSTNGMINKTADLLLKLLNAWANGEKVKYMSAPYKQLAKMVTAGSPMTVYVVEGPCAKEFYSRLEKMQIPHIETLINGQIIIPTAMVPKVEGINLDILAEKQYFQELPVAQLNNISMNGVTIKNMDSYLVEILKNKANIRKEDGKYNDLLNHGITIYTGRTEEWDKTYEYDNLIYDMRQAKDWIEKNTLVPSHIAREKARLEELVKEFKTKLKQEKAQKPKQDKQTTKEKQYYSAKKEYENELTQLNNDLEARRKEILQQFDNNEDYLQASLKEKEAEYKQLHEEYLKRSKINVTIDATRVYDAKGTTPDICTALLHTIVSGSVVDSKSLEIKRDLETDELLRASIASRHAAFVYSNPLMKNNKRAPQYYLKVDDNGAMEYGVTQSRGRGKTPVYRVLERTAAGDPLYYTKLSKSLDSMEDKAITFDFRDFGEELSKKVENRKAFKQMYGPLLEKVNYSNAPSIKSVNEREKNALNAKIADREELSEQIKIAVRRIDQYIRTRMAEQTKAGRDKPEEMLEDYTKYASVVFAEIISHDQLKGTHVEGLDIDREKLYEPIEIDGTKVSAEQALRVLLDNTELLSKGYEELKRINNDGREMIIVRDPEDKSIICAGYIDKNSEEGKSFIERAKDLLRNKYPDFEEPEHEEKETPEEAFIREYADQHIYGLTKAEDNIESNIEAYIINERVDDGKRTQTYEEILEGHMAARSEDMKDTPELIKATKSTPTKVTRREPEYDPEHERTH